MTAQDIIARLFSPKGITSDRIVKAKGMASRSKVEWADVLAAMTDEQRKQVADAS
jgi:hypothetical protein